MFERQPLPLPPRRWRLSLPADRHSPVFQGLDLEPLGFCKFHTAFIECATNDRAINAYWYHPAGVIARTYHPNHNTSPIDALLIFQIDRGTKGRTPLPGWASLSSDLRRDATTTLALNVSTHTNGLGVGEVLRLAQREGRLLPFGRWAETTRHLLFLATKEPRHELLEQLARTAPDELAARLHKELSGDSSWWFWREAEAALDYTSDTLWAAGIRFPRKDLRQRVERWMSAAVGSGVLRVDDSEGPGGLTSVAALLRSRRPEAWGEAERVLRKTPRTTVRRWASVPDAMGLTLGLQAFRMLVNLVPAETPELVAIGARLLQTLIERVGREAVVLDTGHLSALGLLIDQAQRSTGPHRWHPNRLVDFLALGRQAESLGLRWCDRVRCRRLGVDKPMTADLLDELIAPQERDHPALDSLRATLAHRVLDRLLVAGASSVRARL